jgi:hypothetical protein
MKPFDLEKAKKGSEVVTRDVKPARILCFDLKGDMPIIAAIDYGNEEWVSRFTDKGTYEYYKGENSRDLFMASIKKEAWLNVYSEYIVTAFPTKEDAELCAEEDRVACIHIEWEE